MKITEIVPGKGKLFEIRLENEQKIWLHADLVQSEFLRPGVELDEERIAALKAQAALHRAYEYGLYLLE